MTPCHASFVIPTRICGQHRRCMREAGHEGFCMAFHYGWPFYWLRADAETFHTDSDSSVDIHTTTD